jgi:hypothetical protein
MEAVNRCRVPAPIADLGIRSGRRPPESHSLRIKVASDGQDVRARSLASVLLECACFNNIHIFQYIAGEFSRLKIA